MGSKRLSMAELYPLTDTTQMPIGTPVSTPAPPAAVPQIEGPGPLWRSLLFPRRGQRAVEFSSNGSTLFASLRLAGVGIERRRSQDDPAGAATFDLVLEDRRWPPRRDHPRSEEHTSELQSRPQFVCRPLLAKNNLMSVDPNPTGN